MGNLALGEYFYYGFLGWCHSSLYPEPQNSTNLGSVSDQASLASKRLGCIRLDVGAKPVNIL